MSRCTRSGSETMPTVTTALPTLPDTSYVEVPRGPLAVIDIAATGPAGSTAVLVPGYTGSKEDFLPVLLPLAAAGHRVVSFDQRGQYESPGPEGDDAVAAYGVDLLAGDLLALLDNLDTGPVHLVGHSFGGLVARAAVLARPAAARSLTLLASGPEALSGPRVARMIRLEPVLATGGMPAVYAVLEELGERDPRSRDLPAELKAFLRTRFLASTAAGLLGMGRALRAEPDRVEQLRATGVPVLVAYGEGDDGWLPAVQAEMARRLGAGHVVFPAAMHSPAMESPAATVRTLLDFWAGAEG